MSYHVNSEENGDDAENNTAVASAVSNKKAQLTQKGTRDSSACMKAHCEQM